VSKPSNSAFAARRFPGFYRKPAEWEASRETRPYRQQIQRAWAKFKLWGVLCIEGKPTVYFTKVAKANLALEAEWHRTLWNQGSATMLVVQDTTKTRIYSALAKPRREPIRGDDDERIAAMLDVDAFVLETFLLSVQTGQFYREHPAKFDADAAIDQYLLDNLSAARDALIDRTKPDALDAATAHAFLGRCLFTCYLLERGVIGEPAGTKLHRLLRKAKGHVAAAILFRLFQHLEDEFNGSMFGGNLAREKSCIRPWHVEVLTELLSGKDFRANQPLLDFDFYDFRFIPIELISSIYEDFIAAGEKNISPAKNQGKSRTARRKAGAYYTPPRLAELVVDIATEGWDTLRDKRCLDPACGSGIFLVILFQRMAAEWRRQHPKADNVERALALREILTTKLQGVDSDRTACMVACFSLYLAFLDQLAPPDIWKLKAALEKVGTEKVLPPLESRDGRPNGCPVMWAQNFFSPEVDAAGKFQLVIGNPPWVGRNQSASEDTSKAPPDTVMREWLFDAKRNPFLADAPRQKSEREAQFFPEQQSAIAFMWKAPLHLAGDGHACLLLPTRVILSNSTDKFQAAWFSTFSVDAVWQLADYRHILFSGAKCPAVIVKCRAAKPDPATAEIPYYTPKVERLDPRRAAVVVSANEEKRLRLPDLLKAASEDRAYMFWKMPFWGTDRDQRLLRRLRRMPTLGDIAGEPGEKSADGKLKRWVKGQGFKPFYQDRYDANPERYGEPIPREWTDDALFLDARSKRWGLVLLPDDCRHIGPEPAKLHRLPDATVFAGPMVLVNQGCSRFSYSEFGLRFQDALQSIAGPKRDEDLLLFLTALLNTPLATYYTFHTAANLGVERDKVHFEELLQLPFPLPANDTERAIVRDVANRLRRARDEMAAAGLNDDHRATAREQAVQEVTDLVYRYYDLTTWERTLVEETATIFEPSKTPTTYLKPIPTLTDTTQPQRAAYAELLCQTINRWARRSGNALVPSIRVAKREGLALLTLQRTTERELLFTCDERDDLSAAFRQTLVRLAKASSQESASGLTFLRGFAHIEDDCVHILKPLALRHWTKTAALNDADELATYFAGLGSREA
jgi:hypothetical protein